MNTNSGISNSLKILQAIVLSLVILYFGRALFIPLSFAMLISFLLYPVTVWLEKRKIPRVAAITIGLSMISILIAAVFTILWRQFRGFLREWPLLKEKLRDIVQQSQQYLWDTLNISFQQQDNWLQSVMENLADQFFPMAHQVMLASSVSLVLLILIPFYVALILYYRELLVKALYHLFPPEQHEKVRSVLKGIVSTYYNFIKGMIIVYIAVGLLNSLGLWFLKIPHPCF